MAQAAGLVSLPWGEACISESGRAESPPLLLALCFRCGLCWSPLSGRHPPWLEKGSSPLSLTQPYLPSATLRGVGGPPGEAVTVNFRGGEVYPASPLVRVYHSLKRSLLPRMLH